MPCIVLCIVLISAWHLSLRVDITSEAVYEIVVEPILEPQAGLPQAKAVVEPNPEVANPADWQGNPRSITSIFSIQLYYLNIVH